MKQSAGSLLYRAAGQDLSAVDVLEVLLVHPSGNYNRRAPWSIPKGLPDASESLEQAARRETIEETGVTPGNLCSARFGDPAEESQRDTLLRRPNAHAQPRPTSWESIASSKSDTARQLLHPDQVPLLDRLRIFLGGQ